jgi:hypothetical protein
MAVVQGIREKVHLPIYDSFVIPPEKQFRDIVNSNTIKFFVDVQGKTKLETNLQAASLLPHYNTFEARAMRVVISDLPPEFPDDRELEFVCHPCAEEAAEPAAPEVEKGKVTARRSSRRRGIQQAGVHHQRVRATVTQIIKLLQEARQAHDCTADVCHENGKLTPCCCEEPKCYVTMEQLERVLAANQADPPLEQLFPNNGCGTLIGKIIFNTVTSLYVGEKTMIEMPTWFFPGGAGPFSETGNFTTHGEPSPLSTFRFAEPVFIDKQQNFRVEILIPDTEVLREVQKIYGPLTIWVVLDGFMTRDVQ